jgi:hypothetical protein
MPVSNATLGARPARKDVDSADWLVGGGEMGELVRSMDWTKTPLGPLSSWPQSLRTTVSLCLGSNFPISLAWVHTMCRSITTATGPSAEGNTLTPWARTSASAGLRRGPP